MWSGIRVKSNPYDGKGQGGANEPIEKKPGGG